VTKLYYLLIYTYLNLSLKGEESERELVYMPIIVMRLSNISLDSMLTDQQKFNQIRVQVSLPRSMMVPMSCTTFFI